MKNKYQFKSIITNPFQFISVSVGMFLIFILVAIGMNKYYPEFEIYLKEFFKIGRIVRVTIMSMPIFLVWIVFLYSSFHFKAVCIYFYDDFFNLVLKNKNIQINKEDIYKTKIIEVKGIYSRIHIYCLKKQSIILYQFPFSSSKQSFTEFINYYMFFLGLDDSKCNLKKKNNNFIIKIYKS